MHQPVHGGQCHGRITEHFAPHCENAVFAGIARLLRS